MANLEFDLGNDYASRHPGPGPRSDAETPNLREQVIWNLREQGYRDREIAEVLGITRQRVSQIERRLIARATAAKSSRNHLADPAPKGLRRHAKVRVHAVTSEDFERRLNALNRYYEPQLLRLLEGGCNRQKSSTRSALSPLFWKAWPLIEHYQLQPFSFSMLVGDFPVLAGEAHLAQLLSRLRKKGLLRQVGTVRIEGQNLPEVLMAQTPIEDYLAPRIDKLVAIWAYQLRRLNSTFCSDLAANRLARSTSSIRSHLIQSLLKEGRSVAQIESLFFSDRKRKSSNFDGLGRGSAPSHEAHGSH